MMNEPLQIPVNNDQAIVELLKMGVLIHATVNTCMMMQAEILAHLKGEEVEKISAQWALVKDVFARGSFLDLHQTFTDHQSQGDSRNSNG